MTRRRRCSQWIIRRRLQRGAQRLTGYQRAKLVAALDAADPNQDIRAAGIAKELLANYWPAPPPAPCATTSRARLYRFYAFCATKCSIGTPGPSISRLVPNQATGVGGQLWGVTFSGFADKSSSCPRAGRGSGAGQRPTFRRTGTCSARRYRLEPTSSSKARIIHAHGAHDRHEQPGVVVSPDDESPCNSRHLE